MSVFSYVIGAATGGSSGNLYFFHQPTDSISISGSMRSALGIFLEIYPSKSSMNSGKSSGNFYKPTILLSAPFQPNY